MPKERKQRKERNWERRRKRREGGRKRRQEGKAILPVDLCGNEEQKLYYRISAAFKERVGGEPRVACF